MLEKCLKKLAALMPKKKHYFHPFWYVQMANTELVDRGQLRNSTIHYIKYAKARIAQQVGFHFNMYSTLLYTLSASAICLCLIIMLTK